MAHVRIIDAHVHLYPPEVNRNPGDWAQARGETLWSLLSLRRRKDGRAVQTFPDLARLLHDMDEAGVDHAVLLGWYWENPATCALQNQFYSECITRHPDRLSAFGAVHPGSGDAALDEIRRLAGQGFRGLGELSPHSQGFTPTDPTWRRILNLAGELGLPVNLHVTDPSSRRFPGRIETPLEDFIGMATDFPSTRFILAHWGGGLAFERATRKLTNVWFDTAAAPLIYGSDSWKRGLAVAVSERVLFGSDYPLNLYPQQDAEASMSRFLSEAADAGVSQSILGQNLRDLLHLD